MSRKIKNKAKNQNRLQNTNPNASDRGEKNDHKIEKKNTQLEVDNFPQRKMNFSKLKDPITVIVSIISMTIAAFAATVSYKLLATHRANGELTRSNLALQERLTREKQIVDYLARAQQLILATSMTAEQKGQALTSETRTILGKMKTADEKSRVVQFLGNVPVRGMDFSDLKLEGVNFDKGDFTATRFDRSTLTAATFQHSLLSRASFKEAILTSANLSGAVMLGANLTGAKLRLAQLIKTDLSDAILDNAIFAEAEMDDVNLSRVLAILTDFQKSRLIQATCSHAKMPEANFQNADLRGANFGSADLRMANLTGALISNEQLGVNLQLRSYSYREIGVPTEKTFSVNLPLGTFGTASNGEVSVTSTSFIANFKDSLLINARWIDGHICKSEDSSPCK